MGRWQGSYLLPASMKQAGVISILTGHPFPCLWWLHGRLTTLGSAWLGSLCFSSGPASLQHLEREQVTIPRDPASSNCCLWILPGQAVPGSYTTMC